MPRIRQGKEGKGIPEELPARISVEEERTLWEESTRQGTGLPSDFCKIVKI